MNQPFIEPPAIRLDGESAPEPFIFISYAHQNREEVYRDLSYLHESGYRLWYDEGIDLAREFANEIACAIQKCSFFLVFLSPEAVQSSWVLDELAMALRSGKQHLVIYLGPTELPPEWDLRIGRRQCAKRSAQSYDRYCDTLLKSLPDHLRRPQRERAPSPAADFTRLIQERLDVAMDVNPEDLRRLGELMGLDPDETSQILQETLVALGHGPESQQQCERLRVLATELLSCGVLSDMARTILANRGRDWNIHPRRIEVVIQEAALASARALDGRGEPQKALELLRSATAKMIELRSPIRRELEDLARKAEPERPPRETAKPGAPPEPPPAQSTHSDPTLVVRRTKCNLAPGTLLEWIEVPAGLFQRGCPAWFVKHIEESFGVNASVLRTFAPREEHLSAFWIGLTPITNNQFLAFVRATGHRHPSGWLAQPLPFPREQENHPVTGVTWQDAFAFASWLGGRLPSRAEYEKSSRGPDGRIYPWGNNFDSSRCNCAESGRSHALPVGSINGCVSPFGILDLVGNVWQWAADGDEDGRMTVGGAFSSTCEIYGAGFFDVTRPAQSSENTLGFRVACTSLRQLAFPADEPTSLAVLAPPST